MSELETIIKDTKDWLRMNGFFKMKINVHGLYGCFEVEGFYINESIILSRGENLQKHILIVLNKMKEYKEKK